MNENLTYRFGGVSRVYGASNLVKFNNSKVLVVGLGGVGSWCVEALARSGIGSISLCDFDDICISNTNRQLHALEGEIGRFKTESLKDRLLKINPEIEIQIFNDGYSLETESNIFNNHYDFVIDAIDKSLTKFHLANACIERNIKEVVVGSAGGRLDPTQIVLGDLSKSHEDTLLSILRKDLRRKRGLPRKGKMGIDCIHSTEKPRFPLGPDDFTNVKPDHFKKPLDCSTGFGTITHVTGSFGFLATHACLKYLMEN